ncbi:hypothetical protein [Halosimplex pelagicum]|uniref:Uncharacterized protein n=1 Tax=Halosimplex pelagicum TaxID=869886 RepID=A0A7D5PE13_9EURY|nr:hypothetical protein [Halosimplex pelagicum]QLH80979.1 hypothetical protein HZS54_04715 [Halosimplex pelagicum]
MVTLDDDFEDNLRAAVLDEVEQTVRDEIGPELKQAAEENWKAYASRNGYDIDHVWEDATLAVGRDDDSVTVRIEWPELTALFEWGVDPHTIEGNPLLHFYWDAKDTWITTDEVNWGSETGGIPESRAIRDALDQLRGMM